MTDYFVEPHPLLSSALLPQAVPFVCIMNFFHLQPSSVDQFNLDLEEGLARYSVPDTYKNCKNYFLAWVGTSADIWWRRWVRCPIEKTWKTWKQHCKDQTVKPSSDIVFWTIFALKMFVHLVISCFARFLNKAFKKAGMFPSVFQFEIVVKWITREHFYKGTAVRGRACMCCELWGHMHVFFFE